MKKSYPLFSFVLFNLVFSLSIAPAQEKKLEKIRVGGGSASTTQMSLWLAKEGNFYDKHGLNVEAISIPGSSLALQAMLAGELPIIQLGGAASIQANLAGADTVIVATIVRNFSSGFTPCRASTGWRTSRARFSASPASVRFRISPRHCSARPWRRAGPRRDDGPNRRSGGRISRQWLRERSRAASLTPPGTLQARKLKFKLRELFDMTKLDAEYHINGVLTTRKFLRSSEDTVRRFLKAYVEGAARGQKDKNFAFKVMGKYFRTDDKRDLGRKLRHDDPIEFRDSALSFNSGRSELDPRVWRNRTPKPRAQSRKISPIAA